MLGRNCLLKQVIEGKIEGRKNLKGRRERRRKQLQDDLKEKAVYCKLKDETLARAMCRTCFRRYCGPVVRRTAESMCESCPESNDTSRVGR